MINNSDNSTLNINTLERQLLTVVMLVIITITIVLRMKKIVILQFKVTMYFGGTILLSINVAVNKNFNKQHTQTKIDNYFFVQATRGCLIIL